LKGRDRPGCAVAVGEGGRLLLKRAYGMANLEYGIPITPATIFEAGSVSKQFTAGAILLLAQEGKLSLEDPVRKYIPEFPDFGTPVLIRHLLTHTSGIRSQWPMLTLAGRPPGRAVHTIGEILDLVNRQRELNFHPGDEFLYNNTAFTLLSVVVSRVSGQPFQQFCDTRLFKPIGMLNTQWRTDFTKVVKGRATAYEMGRDRAYHTEMSFTDVVGNGGLLTTVEDLWRWNRNLDNPGVGGREWTDALQTRAKLNDGLDTPYGRGLFLGEYRGLTEIFHGGATAGYRAYLTRFPEQRLSISILCNGGNIAPAVLAHQLADIVLDGHLAARPSGQRVEPPGADPGALAGLYRDMKTDAVLHVTFAGGRLRANGMELVPEDGDRLRSAGNVVFEVEKQGEKSRLIERRRWERPVSWLRVPRATPTPAELQEAAGRYRSGELDIVYELRVEKSRLMLRHRPEPEVLLRPLYQDAFDFGMGRVIRLVRDDRGRVNGLSIYAGRVWHLRFDRID